MSAATENTLDLEDLLRAAGFPEVDHAAWKRRVEKELGDAGFTETLVTGLAEGFDVEPLYVEPTPSDAADDDFNLGRSAGGGPRIVEEHEVPQPDLAPALAAGRDLGVSVPWLRMRDRAVVPADLEAWGKLVKETGAERSILEIHGASPIPETAGPWISCSDPLGEAFRGVGDGRLDHALAGPGAKVLASSSPYHEAGASAVDELALALATGVEVLRQGAAAGAPAADAAARVLFVYSLGDDLFLEIAKLRAARGLWGRILGAIGAEDAEVWIHACESRRGRSQEDPRSNLLRSTVRCFAASAGGADTVVLTPYDAETSEPSARGRRLAVLTQQILEQEAHLGRFADPGAGSWYLENLTDRLARGAWKLFQEIESRGGMARCLKDGKIREIVESSAVRRQEVAA